MDAELQQGALTQFDVLMDGELVATRGGGFFARMLGGGWPDPEEVVAAVRTRLQGAR